MKDIKKEIDKLKKNEFFIKSLEGLVNYFEIKEYDTTKPEIKEKINEYGFFIAEKIFSALNAIEEKVQKSPTELRISEGEMYSFLRSGKKSKKVLDISTGTELTIKYDQDIGLNYENYTTDSIDIKLSIDKLITLEFSVKNGDNNKPRISFSNYNIFEPMSYSTYASNNLFHEKKPLPIIHFLRNIVKDNLRQSLKIIDNVNKEEQKKLKKSTYKI